MAQIINSPCSVINSDEVSPVITNVFSAPHNSLIITIYMNLNYKLKASTINVSCNNQVVHDCVYVAKEPSVPDVIMLKLGNIDLTLCRFEVNGNNFADGKRIKYISTFKKFKSKDTT
jgi:hypothetical protein